MRKIFSSLLVLYMCTNLYGVNNNLILSDTFPNKLSDFNFFTDASAQVPNDNVVPYELISTLFSDYSYKQRWIYVPVNQKATHYNEGSVFDFPIGTALIKTFYYPIDERNPSFGMNLLETRLLLRRENGWEAVSYAWNNEQNEAYKKIAGKTINVSWTNFLGEEKDVRYRVPNVNQCKECHAADDKITPIGPKARNINKDFKYKDGEFNQLNYWMTKQIIDSYPLDLVSPVDWSDETQNINDRVRSYLDVNCGHCHSPTGNANSTGLYLHLDETRDIHLGVYKKPVATGRGSGGLKYSIVPGKPDESILLHRMISLDPGVMMPESGRALSHKEAVEMVRDWILLLKE